MIMRTLLEALIGSHNIKNASNYQIITKKDDLRMGDLCMQRDGQIGVYVEDIDLSKFNIHSKEDKTILFLKVGQGMSWQHYPVKYLGIGLKDIDGESEFDMIKVVRGSLTPQVCKDPNLLYKYLSDERNYAKYFE